MLKEMVYNMSYEIMLKKDIKKWSKNAKKWSKKAKKGFDLGCDALAEVHLKVMAADTAMAISKIDELNNFKKLGHTDKVIHLREMGIAI